MGKFLRLKIYQPHAHYRVPFTYQRRHTYPIPPYSTVIGLLCNILGIRNIEDEKELSDFHKLKNIKISICGTFESKSTEYTWFRNLSKESHNSRFGYSKNRRVFGNIEHPGGQIPVLIDVLNDVNLWIYFYHEDESFIEKIKSSFENPQNRIFPLHLGRAEDWIVIQDIRFVELKEKDHGGNFKKFFWIPKSCFQFSDSNFERFSGLLYKIPTFYKITNGKRDFVYIDAKLNDGEIQISKFDMKILYDEDEENPIFLADFVRGSKMEVWAKSKGIRLSKHIEDILKVFEKVKDRIDNNLYLPIKMAIFYHDLGKVLPKFQIESLGNKSYEPFDIIFNVSHSLFSVFWIDKKKLSQMVDNKLVEMVVSSVAYHHWREGFENYIGGRKGLTKFCDWLLENKDKLRKNLQNELSQLINEFNLNINSLDLDIDEKFIREIRNGVLLQNIAIPPYKFDYEPLRESIEKSIEDTKKWILISGFLQRCDHFASWCEEENESLDKVEIECVNNSDVKSKIKQNIGIKDEKQIWQFSKVGNYINKDYKDLILIAPTGYGKTEFAFLWSSNKKFIYTLPLRSAVNQIYDRSLKIFGHDRVGLLHSDADIYLIEKWGDVGDNIKLYELSKNLSFPVIISTGDQFFPYALRPPGYERIFSIFSYSNLVIDEIQAYDPKACAIIVKFIEWVKTMGGNFLLMTATMPEFVKEILKAKNILYEEINIYEEEKQKFEEIVKHKIKFEFIENEGNEFEIPEEILNRAISEAQNGKRVLFILNTVRKAQEVYEKIKERIKNRPETPVKLFLLHSRFILGDKRSKEIEIIDKEFKNPKPEDEKEGKILITTQIVEASLNIDADVLFTEICPLDALVQRMGRVLRRIGANFNFGKMNNTKRVYRDKNKIYEVDFSDPNVYVLVFKNGIESGNGKVYSKELLKLSLASLCIKSKKDIKNMAFEDFVKECSEFFSKDSKKTSKRKGGKTSGSNEIIRRLIEDDEWIISLKVQPFEISEYEKYKIVSLFYKSLPKDGSYLSEFYKTLEILSAGYISDRKKEAERIFREIHDVQIIPEKKLNDFISEIKKTNWENINFTNFKKDILSKFIVSVPYFNVNEEDWIFYKIQERLTDEELDRKNLEKLKEWLSGIFVSQRHLYDEDKGIVVSDRKDGVTIL